jgi:hypothetical protein
MAQDSRTAETSTRRIHKRMSFQALFEAACCGDLPAVLDLLAHDRVDPATWRCAKPQKEERTASP